MTPGDFSRVDPAWAWAGYKPTSERPWDARLAAHLFRRAGFGATRHELTEAVAAGPEAVIARLTANEPDPEHLVSETRGIADSALAAGDPRRLAAWWLYRMLITPQPLAEKMTLFWHGHFATSTEKVNDVPLMFLQNQTLRKYALGNFGPMVHAISRDPAMLVYLDSATNRKAHANENYARELMELFCLGEGNYSEQDVQQLARCFTGWEVRRNEFRFNRFQHDAGDKTIFGVQRKFSGDEAIDLVLEQASCPRFIARKLFRWFICDEPDAPASLIDPLAQTFRENGLEIAALVRKILSSQLFFSEFSVGRKIKSPVELLLGLLKSLDGSGNLNNLVNETAALGQSLFAPPNVKGWDGGRAWINSATLVERANAVYRMLHDQNTRFGKKRLGEYLPKEVASQGDAGLIAYCQELLFAVPFSDDQRSTLSQRLGTLSGSAENRLLNALHLICSLPEFQLA